MKDDILDKIKKKVSENYRIEDVSYIPDIEDSKLTFGNTALRFKASVLYIDIRESSSYFENHRKQTISKIHKAYYYTINKIARNWGGHPRSFNGDSLLVFFPEGRAYTNYAVKSAMEISYMLNANDGIKKVLPKGVNIDFGIGITNGKLLCTKVGMTGKPNNKDLIWLSTAVNKAVRLSDDAKNPYNIHISEDVYNELSDNHIYQIQNQGEQTERKVNMWNLKKYEYNGEYFNGYQTDYYMIVS